MKPSDDAASPTVAPPGLSWGLGGFSWVSVPRPLTPRHGRGTASSDGGSPPGGYGRASCPTAYPPCAMSRRVDLRPASGLVESRPPAWPGLSLAAASDPPSTHHDLRRIAGVRGNTGKLPVHSARLVRTVLPFAASGHGRSRCD